MRARLLANSCVILGAAAIVLACFGDGIPMFLNPGSVLIAGGTVAIAILQGK